MFQPKLEGEALGKMMKERNLACDAVTFGDQSANKKEIFDTLVAAADNNGNCHILHVEPPCSVRRALSSRFIIICLLNWTYSYLITLHATYCPFFWFVIYIVYFVNIFYLQASNHPSS